MADCPALPLVAAVPVSLRAAGNTEATTLATMSRMSLATDVEAPLERLQAIHAGSGRAKALTRGLRSVIPTDFPSFGMPWLFGAAATLVGRARLADRVPPLANLVVSNFPGSSAPLYLAGARLVTWWPLSIVEHGLGLNVTVQSYAGSLRLRRGRRPRRAARPPRVRRRDARGVRRARGRARRENKVTHTTVRGIELDYESFGAAGAPAILLVMGLGMPGIAWPDPLVDDGLVAAGFRVIRFDNRDCGHSSKVAGGRLPDLRMAIARALLRRTVRAPYTLDDMAADAVGLLDALGIERAHLVGASMGGMIAQNAAALFPQRVASLTSIMASTGNPSLRVSIGKPRALRVLLLRPAPATATPRPSSSTTSACSA